MISDIDKKRLLKKKTVKVRPLPRASVDDMLHTYDLYCKNALIQLFYMLAQIIV